MKTEFKKTDCYTTQNLFDISKNVLKEINDIVESTTFENKKVYEYKTKNLKEVLNTDSLTEKLGICDFKRFKRILSSVTKKGSIKSINKLLRFIYSKLLKTSIPQVDCPIHNEVQKYKKEWKAKQLAADSALKEYNLYKSDFYKKINFNKF